MNEQLKKLESWQTYVDEIKEQKPEEYLAGDIEGYRRGYGDGSKAGEQKAIDLTLAGMILVAIIAGAIGFAFGVAVWAT